MFIDLEDLDNSGNKSQITLTSDSDSAQPFRANIINNNDILDKLFIPCIENKLTRVVRRNKSMTPMANKFEEVHTDF